MALIVLCKKLMSKQLKIAVVGGGIAGITAAYLLGKNHDITLFDKNNYLGGHTNTFVVPDGEDKGTAVDTGFIVMNDRTYPLFHKLLKEWEVPYRSSDMSFAFWDRKTDFNYAYTNLNGVLSQRSNFFDPKYWKLGYELFHFFKKSRLALKHGHETDMTLRHFIEKEKVSKDLQEKYLLPMGSAIWSVPYAKILEFPAISFLGFLDRHGLLNLWNLPQWQTVVGGSHSYVKAFKKKFTGKIILNEPIKNIFRNQELVVVLTKNENYRFDKVVIAAHADEALSMLSNPTEQEIELLSPWKYESNNIVLHTDHLIMPTHKRAWASWNFHKHDKEDLCTLTYHMNRLQGLKTHHDYFVTLNSPEKIPEEKILYKVVYHHPVYTLAALKTQDKLASLNGVLNTYFCGSYFGHGFHEDAVKSATGIVI